MSETSLSDTPVTVADHAAVRVITVNRPDKLNGGTVRTAELMELPGCLGV